MIIVTDTAIVEYVAAWYSRTKLPFDLADAQVQAHIAVTKTVRDAGPRILDLKQLHQQLLGHADPYAGEYRFREGVLQNGTVVRTVPRSTAVPQLMVREFYPSYKAVLHGPQPANPGPLSEPNRIALMLRAIHPFRSGNARLAHLLFNQIRLQLDHSWLWPEESSCNQTIFNQLDFVNNFRRANDRFYDLQPGA